MSAQTIARDTYADLGGGIGADPDLPPTHHVRCDGTGWTPGRREDRLPVACPACRPHLAVRPKWGRHPRLTLVE